MTDWKTAYEVCELKKRLEKEDASKNKESGKYLDAFRLCEWFYTCIEGVKGSLHEVDRFDVRTVQWAGLEKAFVDAGYDVVTYLD